MAKNVDAGTASWADLIPGRTKPESNTAENSVATRSPVAFALEREIQRRRTEHHQQSERTPPGPVRRHEPRVLAGLQHDVLGLPEQRVVDAEPVRTGRQFVRDALAMAEDGDFLAIDQQE